MCAEEKHDGIWVLRTNTALPMIEVALRCKELWQVEQVFRTAKSLRDTRPIFHKCDQTIRGHVFCSFLALLMQKELFLRMAEAGIDNGGSARPRQGRNPALRRRPAADHHTPHRRRDRKREGNPRIDLTTDIGSGIANPAKRSATRPKSARNSLIINKTRSQTVEDEANMNRHGSATDHEGSCQKEDWFVDPEDRQLPRHQISF